MALCALNIAIFSVDSAVESVPNNSNSGNNMAKYKKTEDTINARWRLITMIPITTMITMMKIMMIMMLVLKPRMYAEVLMCRTTRGFVLFV